MSVCVDTIKKINMAVIIAAFFALSIMSACPGMSMMMADTGMHISGISMNCSSAPQSQCLFDLGKHIQGISIPQERQKLLVSQLLLVIGVLLLAVRFCGDDSRLRSRWLFYRFKNSLTQLLNYFVLLFSDGILNPKLHA